MDGTRFFMDQLRAQHVSRLNSWASQVRSARTAAAALQAALTLEPSPHPLIRGMTSIYGNDKNRAKRSIEICLMEHLMNIGGSDILVCLPLARRITWSVRIREWASKAARAQASVGKD